ncbi:hypothetical protein [Angustibacter luteus]|uniref:Uncharacterized protein n=1 Tax=Angustibacter luteus TaxID=658456 RepID=A0ABW1JDW3_9ACTN
MAATPLPRRGPSLDERSRATGIGTGQPAPARWSPRHCWVEGHHGWPGRWPGVILEWRQLDEGWQGRVAFVLVLGREVCLVESWLDADVLRPTAG